jgi:hypothetical protein
MADVLWLSPKGGWEMWAIWGKMEERIDAGEQRWYP